MRLGLQLGYDDPASAPGLAAEAERCGFHSVWTSEAYGSDAIGPLAWIGARTERILLGTAIAQMPARSPATTAATAATLDHLSGGRVLLGLGTSGPQVAEGWHGQAWGKPLGRTREYVAIVRAILRREAPLEHHGVHYDIPYSGDDATGLFFMRVHFAAPPHMAQVELLDNLFAHVRGQFGMQARFHAVAKRPRVLLMVSQHGHCLNDLLFRAQSGQLEVEIPAIVSNHTAFAGLAQSYGIAFHHLPLPAGSSAATKRAQELQIEALVERERIDLVVLARYMQILSPGLCQALAGRAINIHHSFLPSFKGAKPYFQAHGRGVKLIGATAHYVTAELDEGPIIEQDVERVDHSLSPEDFTAVGRDVESVVLARAVRWHVEHRVLLNGHKTVVFS